MGIPTLTFPSLLYNNVPGPWLYYGNFRYTRYTYYYYYWYLFIICHYLEQVISYFPIIIATIIIFLFIYLQPFCTLLPVIGGYSSAAEHSTADREVTGSTPVAPLKLFQVFQLSTICELFTDT